MYRQEFVSLVKLATPLVIAQLAQNTISFVDTLMVGTLGNDALAAISLGSTVFFFVFILLSGVMFGVSPIVSQATGANDQETVGRATRQALWLGLALAIPAMVLFWNIHPILIWLDQPPDTALLGSQYLRAISFGLLPGLWIMALRGLLEGRSNTRPLMVLAISGVALNVLLNNVFMFGWWGFPELGLVGTGIASSLVFFSGFVFMAGYIHLRYPELHVFSKIRSPDSSMMRELIRLGGPISMTLGFEASMFSAAALAMGTLGKPELAAHQIALQSASITFMIPLGVAIATSVRVGTAVGRKSTADAERAGHVGMFLCMALMVITACVFYLAPTWIVSLYIDTSDAQNDRVVELATGFLTIAALFQIFDGLQVSASSALRGLKDTTAAMVLTLVSYWGVGMLAGWMLCFVYGFNGNGLWLGMTLGLATAAVLLSNRFQWKIRALGREISHATP